jgi:phage/plasmid-associated DNA primase
MRGEWFQFRPEFKVWMATNHKRAIHGADAAIWDRIKLIPFTVRISTEIPRREMRAKLRAELPGILAWIVRGCLEWQRSGLGVPEEVAAATDAYRQEMDIVGRFVDECCMLPPGASVGATPLYHAYTQWCEQNDEEPLKQQTFGRRLSDRGFERKRGTAGRSTWRGLGLRESDRSDPSDPHSGDNSHEENESGVDPEVRFTWFTPEAAGPAGGEAGLEDLRGSDAVGLADEVWESDAGLEGDPWEADANGLEDERMGDGVHRSGDLGPHAARHADRDQDPF